MSDEERFDIVSFIVPRHKSTLYKMFQTKEQLHRALDEAIAKGSNVFSIRKVVKE